MSASLSMERKWKQNLPLCQLILDFLLFINIWWFITRAKEVREWESLKCIDEFQSQPLMKNRNFRK